MPKFIIGKDDVQGENVAGNPKMRKGNIFLSSAKNKPGETFSVPLMMRP